MLEFHTSVMLLFVCGGVSISQQQLPLIDPLLHLHDTSFTATTAADALPYYYPTLRPTRVPPSRNGNSVANRLWGGHTPSPNACPTPCAAATRSVCSHSGGYPCHCNHKHALAFFPKSTCKCPDHQAMCVIHLDDMPTPSPTLVPTGANVLTAADSDCSGVYEVRIVKAIRMTAKYTCTEMVGTPDCAANCLTAVDQTLIMKLRQSHQMLEMYTKCAKRRHCIINREVCGHAASPYYLPGPAAPVCLSHSSLHDSITKLHYTSLQSGSALAQQSVPDSCKFVQELVLDMCADFNNSTVVNYDPHRCIRACEFQIENSKSPQAVLVQISINQVEGSKRYCNWKRFVRKKFCAPSMYNLNSDAHMLCIMSHISCLMCIRYQVSYSMCRIIVISSHV